MLSKEFIEKMKVRLLADQAKLTEELAGIAPHTELGEGEDAANELPTDEVNQDVIAVIKADLAKIAIALSKIEDGTYGIGIDGREIDEKRLEANPYADKAI